ncbi:related to deacetylase [Cephalotrichum gorgonifer]|uniref:Related to deacetylase n=1 Tax=Cephalotrichum gorgonifer TaxID=2041049 RepID=A0AAE8T066_9PEZI|nr:related to deacetylase [Cephalotrichum gorgonifer]
MSLRYLLGALAIGASASPVAKSQLEQRQAGAVITSCTTPGTVAVTFDDGPFIYTEQVLNGLAAGGVKATFFLNGQNWGNINDYTGIVQRMINEGHQIGSHTWSHPDLATLDAAGVTSQMTQLESTLLNIIGKFPTYMRPPYFSYSQATLNTLGGLGYKVVNADIDTKDYENNTPGTIGVAIANFENGLNAGGSISLAHDVHQTTATHLVPAIVSAIQSRGLRAVTVGECLGDAPANWYRTSRDGGGGDPGNPGGGGTTPDGTCGGSAGYTCPTGYDRCCSQYGWCGDTAEHCTTGCNPAFGICW